MSVSFVKKIAEEGCFVIALITSINTDNRLFHAYIMFESDRINEIREALKYNDVDLRKYGIILASGFGSDPTKEMKEYIAGRKFLETTADTV